MPGGGLSQVLVLDNQASGGPDSKAPAGGLQNAGSICSIPGFPPKLSAGFLEGPGQESLCRGAASFPGWYTLGIKKQRTRSVHGASGRESETLNYRGQN